MGDRGRTSDCSNQNKQHLGIAKLRLPTLAVAGSGSSTLKTHFHDAEPFHFELFRSEANKGSPPPPLLAALFSNDFFRIPGTANGSSRPNLVIQNNPAPDFIAKNPLVGMLAGLFSEIKQEVGMEARKFWLNQSEYLKECMRRSRKPAAIYTNNITPPTDDTANNNTPFLKLEKELSFFVRLIFEIMEGGDSEGIKKKAACEMPSLPDIYNNNSSTKAATTSVDTSVNADGASFNHTPNISGFNTLFNLASKRKY